jgi:group II intron reverse transcriptase/maturase
MVERQNMAAAYRRVMRNKGAAGVDGMPVESLLEHLRMSWREIRALLLRGEYVPSPVREVAIPKAGGGKRTLGIPTCVDRLLQQALKQVLEPIFDGEFSESSYGYRPGRGAHQAVEAARVHVAEGHRWVVDLDIEQFFDRVNHDILMSRVARKINDRRVLGLIRRFLNAGALAGGIETVRREGTPQGSPLSPLLSNILLDDLDKELERRGHRFCRYADDVHIYVRSKAAAGRVLCSMGRFLEKRLRLRINPEKSAASRPWDRSYLGYSMTMHKSGRLKVAAESVRRFKEKVREVFRVGRGRSVVWIIKTLGRLLRGWAGYFRLSEVKGVFDDLDSWIRRKLRCVLWRQWKRVYTRQRNLRKRGLSEERSWQGARNGRGPWWNAGSSHMNQAYPAQYFTRLGLLSLQEERRRLQSIR